MKHLTIFLLFAGLVLCLSGCRLNHMELEKMQNFLDGVVEEIGDSQITDNEDLVGARSLADSTDPYAGDYMSECDSITGRDVIFGGTSIHNRELFLSGTVQEEGGKATVRIRLNGDVFELEPDDTGNFETTLKLHNGGNYIMVVYEDFSGCVEMACEYAAQDDVYEE